MGLLRVAARIALTRRRWNMLKTLISAAATVALLALTPSASAYTWSPVEAGFPGPFNGTNGTATTGAIGAGWLVGTGHNYGEEGGLWWLNGGPTSGTWENVEPGNSWVGVTTDGNGNPWAVSYVPACSWKAPNGVTYDGGYTYEGVYSNGNWSFQQIDTAQPQCVYAIAVGTGIGQVWAINAGSAGGTSVMQWLGSPYGWLDWGLYTGINSIMLQIAVMPSNECNGPEVWVIDEYGDVLRSTSSIGGRYHVCGQNTLVGAVPPGCSGGAGITSGFVQCDNYLYEQNGIFTLGSDPWTTVASGLPVCYSGGVVEYGTGQIGSAPGILYSVPAVGGGQTPWDSCYLYW
jgi:hypothetical protein